KPNPDAAQPRCGGQHLQDSNVPAQGRSDQSPANIQAVSPTSEKNNASEGNSASAIVRWLEENEIDAPWTPEAR
ncbi:hypothetical protein FB567DRAFT_413310, partial [Paraphoma chrysanthemicola]